MIFIADENVDRPIVLALRELGYEVRHIAESDPGVVDERVLEYSRNEDAVLITADKDFGELVFRQKLSYSGVLLLRLSGLTPKMKAALTATVISQHAAELPHAFAVLSPGAFRIRRAG